MNWPRGHNYDLETPSRTTPLGRDAANAPQGRRGARGCCARDASRRGERMTITDHGAGPRAFRSSSAGRSQKTTRGRLFRSGTGARSHPNPGVVPGAGIKLFAWVYREQGQSRPPTSALRAASRRTGKRDVIHLPNWRNRPQPADLQATARSGRKRALSRHSGTVREPRPPD